MKRSIAVLLLLVLFGLAFGTTFGQSPPVNPAIDMKGFLRLAEKAAQYREERRFTEEEFIRTSSQKGVVVLDARSKEKFDELHIKNAVNLSFPDITVASLQQLLPDKNAKILIYCNNNFTNAEQPFPTKMPAASLNISTYISLYTYGYRNIYELGPLIDINTSKLEFEGVLAKKNNASLSDKRPAIDQFK
jgi:hypothetical protein